MSNDLTFKIPSKTSLPFLSSYRPSVCKNVIKIGSELTEPEESAKFIHLRFNVNLTTVITQIENRRLQHNKNLCAENEGEF